MRKDGSDEVRSGRNELRLAATGCEGPLAAILLRISRAIRATFDLPPHVGVLLILPSPAQARELGCGRPSFELPAHIYVAPPIRCGPSPAEPATSPREPSATFYPPSGL